MNDSAEYRAAEQASGIAIIGAACRLPGADDPLQFWNNLCQGIESIRFFSDEELLAAGVNADLLAHPNYVKAAPVLNNVDQFDAGFFAYSPKEAMLMDPQQRLFLEVAWETFEDAGYYSEAYDGVIGVIAGGGGIVTSYMVAHHDSIDLPGQTAELPHLGNDKDFLSTRVSYKLNLTGPSFTVQTACSTSLVAVHLACQNLLNGECDMVLAGGSTVRIPHVSGYLAEKGNVHSLDGHCRAFSGAGQGTIFGSGVVAILLKNLDDALADGDHVYAVIKSTAINNDGANKVSYAAPSVSGQARAMVEAFALADIEPDTLGYVECHATGTTVGDPLEIQALSRAFRLHTQAKQFCAVGSVKANIGHPEQSAGLAALLKTTLALKYKRIPPSLHSETLNPQIDFHNSPFFVNDKLNDWNAVANLPRRAAVNSLGIGGTNAFAILEEAPETLSISSSNERPAHLFCLSAKTRTGLSAYAKKFQSFLKYQNDIALADICYTSNVSRSYFPHRLAVTTSSIADLRNQLNAFNAANLDFAYSHKTQKSPIVFLFSGQGAQYPGMASQLYRSQPLFRDTLEHCSELFQPYLDQALPEILFAGTEHAGLIHETLYTQPILFALEYSLAQLWQSLGIIPDAVMGHSIGEISAACIAGVMTLPDAVKLVSERARLMQSLPGNGSMAVVFAPENVLQEILVPYSDNVAIGAVNSPLNTVISGQREALAEILEQLKKQDILTQDLTVSHAFHSPLMTPILDDFEKIAASIDYQTPQLPLISNVSGTIMQQSPDAAYWRDHIRQAVRFSDGMRTLHDQGYKTFLEIGPGSTLLGLGRQSPIRNDAIWLASLSKQQHDWQVMLDSLQKLYLAGFKINWPQLERGFQRQRLSLPTYPFERKRYWLSQASSQAKTATAIHQTPLSPDKHPLLGNRLRSSLKELQFETVYSLEQLPYLNDHRIYDQVVLPTTAGLEAALAAAEVYFAGASARLENLIYHQALILNDEARLVQLIVTPHNNTKADFQLLSNKLETSDDAAWCLHMSATLYKSDVTETASGQSSESVLSAVRTRCTQTLSPEHYYAALRQYGLNYGEQFQGIRQIRLGKQELIAEVGLAENISSEAYQLHPVLLDACLHVYPALLEDLAADAPNFTAPAYLPVGLQGFQVYQKKQKRSWVHAQLRNDSVADSDIRIIDFWLYDAAAKPIATIGGLSVRRLSAEALNPAAAPEFMNWLYQLRWREQPSLIPAPGAIENHVTENWLIFADRADNVGKTLAAQAEQLGIGCHLVFPGNEFHRAETRQWTVNMTRPDDFHQLLGELAEFDAEHWQRIVYLWALDSPAMSEMSLDQLETAELINSGAALFLTQALAAKRNARFSPSLWLVTRNAQAPVEDIPASAAQATLWGLGRTIELEYPNSWGGLIDLPATENMGDTDNSSSLLNELLNNNEENQVALRKNKRFAARLVRLEPEPATEDEIDKTVIHDNASYLISGGLGMIGLKVADWLVSQGARTLILTSRREPRAEARKAIDELTKRGAAIHVMQADISREADVARIFASINKLNLAPLKGIIHGAGVLQDSIISQFDWDRFSQGSAAKIKGGWLLHRYSQDLALDFFVVQSSLLSLTGSAGQANYTSANAFLDALVDYRRSSGLPATGINWGPWDEAGMARASGERGEAIWTQKGMQYLPPEQAMRVFDYVMRQQLKQTAVTITRWPDYLRQFASRTPALYTELVAGESTASVNNNHSAVLQQQLQQAAAENHYQIVVDFVRTQVMLQLGFEETIDSQQALNELGLDSLMAVNLANRLENTLGVSVSVAHLIQGPSVEQLVTQLMPVLETTAATSEAPPAGTGTETKPAETAADQTWLVFPKPNPNARMRLFCFPYAGAGAAVFRPWTDWLDPAIELVAIEPPGRAGRIDEPAIDNFEAFLDALLPELQPYLDKPFACFGHCLGALTAYDTLSVLSESQALLMQHLFVSGARPPHRLHSEGLFEEQLLADLLTYPEFDPLLPTYEQPDKVFAEVIRHFNIGATDELLANNELRHLLLPTIRAEFAMTFNYQQRRRPAWEIPISCFIGVDDPYVTREDAVLWSEYTNVAFQFYLRQGTHFTVVDDREFIVKTINRLLTA